MPVHVVSAKLCDVMKYQHILKSGWSRHRVLSAAAQRSIQPLWIHTNCSSHKPRVWSPVAHRAYIAANVLHGRVRR